MSSNHESSGIRASKKFYDKIRSYSQELKLDAAPPDRKLSKLPDESKFGCISKEDLESILESYKQQQSDASLRDKPVKCDNVTGGSFAKLLYSKEAFHDPASTRSLIDDLEIVDVHRYSFLGGLSTYATTDDEKLSGIKKDQNRMYIEKVSIEISQLLSSENIESKQVESIKEKIDEISKMNPSDGNVFAARGHYNLYCRRHQDAVYSLRLAVEKGCLRMNKLLATALSEYGLSCFHKRDYKTAHDNFFEALQYDNSNKLAQHHLERCKTHLQKVPFGYENRFANHRG